MKFILKPHSLIDIITNSSSEVFIIQNKSIDIIKQLIRDMDADPEHFSFLLYTGEEDYLKYSYTEDLSEGDVIISIDRDRAYELELQDVSAMLQDISYYYTFDG